MIFNKKCTNTRIKFVSIQKKRINLFGESKAEKVAQDMGIPFLGRLPVDPELAALCDHGEIENFNKNYVDDCIDMFENKFKSDKKEIF